MLSCVPVSALHWDEASGLLFVGVGPLCRAFAPSEGLVFEQRCGGTVHGFASSPTAVIAFGERSALWFARTKDGTPRFAAQTSALPDATLAATLSSSLLLLGFAHGFTERWELLRSAEGIEEIRAVQGSRVAPSEDVAAMVLSCMTLTSRGVAASGTFLGDVFLWSAETGQVLQSISRAHDGPVNCIAFCDDFSCMATASDDKSVRCWVRRQQQHEVAFAQTNALYGSIGRVWRSAVVADEFVVGCGQDGTTRVWSRSSGTLLGRADVHLENHVWAMCSWRLCNGEIMIATGGNDGSVKMFPISAALRSVSGSAVAELVVSGGDAAAHHRICLPSRCVLVATTRGRLLSFDLLSLRSQVRVEQFGFSPTCMAVDSRGTVVAVGGPSGQVAIFNLSRAPQEKSEANLLSGNEKVIEICILRLEGRLLVLASDWKGRISVWSVEFPLLRALGCCKLPERAGTSCNHRVATSFAVSEDLSFLVVGDECGSLHLFEFSQDRVGELPLLSRAAHGHSRITSLNVVAREDHRGTAVLLSTGRDGSFCRWELSSSSLFLLERRPAWKSIRIDGAQLMDGSSGEAVAWGILKDSIVVQSMKDSSVVWQIRTPKARNFDVGFYRDASLPWVTAFNGKLLFLLRPPEIQEVCSARTIQQGAHAKECNCIKWISTRSFITGSRDRSLRLWSFDPSARVLQSVQEVFGHSSTVRCIALSPRSESSMIRVLSGGGYSELLCSSIERHCGREWISPSFNAPFCFDEPRSQPEDEDSDCRVTCIAALPDALFSASSDGFCYLLKYASAVAAADAAAAVPGGFSIVSKRELPSMCLAAIPVGRSLVAVGLLNGHVEVLAAQTLSTLCTVQAHSTGTNSLAFIPCAGLSGWIVSCGDDQALSISKFDEHQLSLVASISSADYSALTCVSVCNGKIVTCGLSQLLRQWHFDSASNKLTEVASPIPVDIAEPAAIDTIATSEKSFCIAVAGQGVQVFQMPY